MYKRQTSVSREQFRDGLKTHLLTQDENFLWELSFKRVYDINIDIDIDIDVKPTEKDGNILLFH